ncbi:hypothetical protein [Pseudomonas syringae]
MPAIKERPILFSAPMVRAILEGRKTVTRRVVNNDWIQSERLPLETASGLFHFWCSGEHPCPHGRPGERLWVREAWAADAQLDAIAPRELSQGEPIRYPADGAIRQTGCSMITLGKPRPSIHMPRWTSRILLEITDVHVERLQEISEDQAMAEGVDSQAAASFRSTWIDRPTGFAFRDLWISINGAEAWDANPWVWVVEFKRVTP